MKDFLFGTATAAAQVEGGWNQDGRGPSIWDDYSARGLIYQNHTTYKACDCYNRVDEDIQILKDLGVNSYRFSISWSRIQPKGYGELNQKGIDFYNNLINKLLEAGIKPLITLFHWDLPLELEKKGGLHNRDMIVERFSEYGKIVAENFSDRVNLFTVFNEAEAIIDFMFLRPVGAAYPGSTKQEAFEGIHTLLLCNAAATYSLRKYSKQPIQVGMVNCMPFCPIPRTPEEEHLARKVVFAKRSNSLFSNTIFWDPVFFGKYDEEHLKSHNLDTSFIREGDMEYIKCDLDFMGLNIYIGKFIEENDKGEIVESPFSPNAVVATMCGEFMETSSAMYYGPKFMYEKYKKPIYITENGCSLPDYIINGKIQDDLRSEYIRRYINELVRAKKDGVDIKGYYVWSLLDNFEWSSGYSIRFGLVHVNFETCERTKKQSFYTYKKIIEQYNTVE